jgi:hypothetical protein
MLGIALLHLDDWQGTREVGVPVANPTWEEVLAALSHLDGETRTLLSLERSDGTALQVAGGPSEFIVQYLDGESCWCVTSDRPVRETVKLVAGGQLGDYAADLCVSGAQAQAAADSFFALGARSPTVPWRKQS